MIKLLKKGFKVNDKYYPAWYSKAINNINGNATIYLKSYDGLNKEAYQIIQKEGMTLSNDTDGMSDYFEKDKIRVPPNNKYFHQVESLSSGY